MKLTTWASVNHPYYAQHAQHTGAHNNPASRDAIIMPPDANPPSSPTQALADLHLSLDSHSASGESSSTTVNGIKTAVNGHHTSSSVDGLDSTHKLQQELERTREERDELAAQYRNLLGKLQNMRNTLGNKLKQDAVRTPNPDPRFKFTRSPRKSLTGANSKWLSSLRKMKTFCRRSKRCSPKHLPRMQKPSVRRGSSMRYGRRH